MPRTATQKRQQQGFDERIVDDPELEDALSRMFENKQAASDYAAAAEEVKRIVVENHDIKPEETVRCGEYVIPGVKRSGGNFHVPEWERIGIGRIASDSGDTRSTSS